MLKKETDKYIKESTENITGIREIKSLGIKVMTEKLINKTLTNLFKNSKDIRKYEISYYTLNGFVYLVLEFLILFNSRIFGLSRKNFLSFLCND